MAQAIDTEQLLKLSAPKRLELMFLIWNSLIAEGTEVRPGDSDLDEAERRITELKEHPERGVSLEEMRKRRGWKA